MDRVQLCHGEKLGSSRGSIWKAVSKEWIQHTVNNWCASKLWRYMHTWSECVKFFPWMICSLVESRQSADKFGLTEYKLFYLVVSITWWKKKKTKHRNAPGDENAHISNLQCLHQHLTVEHCSYPQEMNISLSASCNEMVKRTNTSCSPIWILHQRFAEMLTVQVYLMQ